MQFLNKLSFKTKYTLALSTIALFSIFAYFNLNTLTNSQEDDGEILSVSAGEGVLSQKIALYAITNNKEDLKVSITLMENSHKFLTSKPMSKELKEVYFSKPIELEKLIQKYLYHAKEFIKSEDQSDLKYILNNSEDLFDELDYATSIYQDESDLKVKALQDRELYILLLTLFALFSEAMFIFNPINRSVQKKTKDLLNQKEYLNLITDINTNAIIAVDESFNILTFNKSAEDMFGFSAKEMLYTKLLDDRIIPTKYLKKHISGISNFMKTGKLKNDHIVFELLGQNKDKEIFPIRISFGIRIEENKKIVVANIQDITKDKEKDRLIVEQSRFAAMGEMIANIAHQWRQPLSAISTIATGAKLRYKNNLISDEELDDTFVKIKEHTLHLSKTIDDFRDFFSHEKKKEIFSIDDVVKKSISLTDAMYKDNHINILFNILNPNLMINGSESELSQVFLNILNNAKDILVEKDIQNRIVKIDIFEEDNEAVVRIFDNAGGIPENIITKVFDPYFTTKHKSQGTGIGLFMSKKIITQKFNGMVSVCNSEFIIDEIVESGAEFLVKIKIS